MMYGVMWVVFSVLVGIYAGSRGRGSGNWFVLALVISPLLALIFCAASKNLAQDAVVKAIQDAQPNDRTHKRCPKCAEFVLPDAQVCKHCGTELTPDPGYAIRRHTQAAETKREDAKNQAIGIAIAVGIIGLIIWIAK